jgi:hypothetical protein
MAIFPEMPSLWDCSLTGRHICHRRQHAFQSMASELTRCRRQVTPVHQYMQKTCPASDPVACQLDGQAFLTTQLSSMHLQSIGYKTKALATDD